MCIDLEIIMVVRHSKVFLLLISVVPLLTEAQRGCPVEGCDSRGLYCQADFQVSFCFNYIVIVGYCLWKA